MKKNSTGMSKLIRSLIVLFPENKTDDVKLLNSRAQNDDPVLVAGKANAVGAVYKFPAVTPGLEAMITITGLNQNQNPDDNDIIFTNEHSGNTETLVRPSEVKMDEESWVSFKIDFNDVEIVPEVKKTSFRMTLNNLFYNLI